MTAADKPPVPVVSDAAVEAAMKVAYPTTPADLLQSPGFSEARSYIRRMLAAAAPHMKENS